MTNHETPLSMTSFQDIPGIFSQFASVTWVQIGLSRENLWSCCWELFLKILRANSYVFWSANFNCLFPIHATRLTAGLTLLRRRKRKPFDTKGTGHETARCFVVFSGECWNHVPGLAIAIIMGKKDKASEKKRDADDNENEDGGSDRPSYEELITKVSVISKPLASKKLTKKLYKTVKKGKDLGPCHGHACCCYCQLNCGISQNCRCKSLRIKNTSAACYTVKVFIFFSF